MYLDHFGLTAYPFSTAADPRFYYPSAKHREALACLLYAVEQRKGFALITGEVGAGKSMLCRAALDRLGAGVHVALIVHPLLGPKQFFQSLVSQYGLPSRRRSKVEMIHRLQGFLTSCQDDGGNAVLIVDEAQDLTPRVLEEVRLLGNQETVAGKLLQIVLVGQPELRRLIGTSDLRALDQRIGIKFHLGPLSDEDVAGYVAHRLKVAGAERSLFEPQAVTEVNRAAGGVPRKLNVICDQALLTAFVSDQLTVTADAVRQVIQEMEGYYMDAPAGDGLPDGGRTGAYVVPPRSAAAPPPPEPVAERVHERFAAPQPPPQEPVQTELPPTAFLSFTPAAAAPAPPAVPVPPAAPTVTGGPSIPGRRFAGAPGRRRSRPVARPVRAGSSGPDDEAVESVTLGGTDFADIAELCAAVEDERLDVAYVPRSTSREFARYELNGHTVLVRLVHAGTHDYAVLSVPLGPAQGMNGSTDSLAEDLGYAKGSDHAYVRADDALICTLKVTPWKTHLACRCADGTEDAPLADRIRALHDDLARLISR